MKEKEVEKKNGVSVPSNEKQILAVKLKGSTAYAGESQNRRSDCSSRGVCSRSGSRWTTPV